MTTIDEVLELYRRWGHEHYDEDLAQLDHALQTAALARRSGAPDDLVAAALLHDVGHLLALRDGSTEPHERTGPAYLAPLFPRAVVAPIELHVDAKRYLCAADAAYTRRLSPGSMRSLRRQGGPMTGPERSEFERKAGWAEAVALRRWDDGGKLVEAEVEGLEAYETLLRGLACSGS